jgi:hypothetical protein
MPTGSLRAKRNIFCNREIIFFSFLLSMAAEASLIYTFRTRFSKQEMEFKRQREAAGS